MKDLIGRINFLAAKKKNEGLSEEEAKEQEKLREEYIKKFRASTKEHLMNIKVVDEKGNDVTPKKLREAQNERKKS